MFRCYPSFARQTTVTGTAGMVYDFRERTYEQEENGFAADDGDKQKVGIRPEILVVSKDIRDTLSVRYVPAII